MATKSRNAVLIFAGVCLFVIYKGYDSGHFSKTPSSQNTESDQSLEDQSFSENTDLKKTPRKPTSIAPLETTVLSEIEEESKPDGHNHEDCLESLRYAQENMERAELSAKELQELEEQMQREHEEWESKAKQEFEDYVVTEDGERRSKAELEEEFLREIQRIEDDNDPVDYDDMEI